jgi:hypothetical protein
MKRLIQTVRASGEEGELEGEEGVYRGLVWGEDRPV